MTQSRVRTTLALPSDLLEAIDRAVQEGTAHSRNDFVAQSLRRELAARERTAIDAAFAAMADDLEYLTEAQSIATEFAAADWEALQRAETEP